MKIRLLSDLGTNRFSLNINDARNKRAGAPPAKGSETTVILLTGLWGQKHAPAWDPIHRMKAKGATEILRPHPIACAECLRGLVVLADRLRRADKLVLRIATCKAPAPIRFSDPVRGRILVTYKRNILSKPPQTVLAVLTPGWVQLLQIASP